jgi:tRNA threonylcarbamoyladenosine biosynthesis protein TsaE
MIQRSIFLIDEEATLALGSRLAEKLPESCVVYLYGDLGAGKTTFIRGVLRALGYTRRVKSPTYALVEAYQLPTKNVYHFDLYRLNDPKELQYMGIEDYFASDALSFIEWPERGLGLLPVADLQCRFIHQGTGRVVQWEASTSIGQTILSTLALNGDR